MINVLKLCHLSQHQLGLKTTSLKMKQQNKTGCAKELKKGKKELTRLTRPL